ncbi:MAG: PAS domain S-box protein [Desulfonatronovibrio sp.]
MPRPPNKKNESSQSPLSDPQDILENAPVGVFTSTPDGRYLYVNNTLAQILGYNSPQQLMDSIIDIGAQIYVNPADRVEFMRLMEEYGEVLNHECRFKRRDGSEFWVSRSARSIRDENGRVVAYQGFNTDITDRKKTEERQKIFFQMLQNSEHIAVFKDPSLKYVLINDVYTKMTGHTPSEVIGKTDKELFQHISTPEQIEKYMNNDRKALALSPGQVFSIEESLFDEDCGLRTFMTKKFPVHDEHGILLGVGTITSEITERKKAEETLAKQKQIMAQAEELAELGSWAWDITNDTWQLSDNWKRIHGVPDIQLTTPQLLPIAHPEDKPFIEEAFAKAVEEGKPYDIEHRIVRQDSGEVRYVRAKGLVELDDTGQPKSLVGATQDITEGKWAEEALRQSERKFKELAELAPVMITIQTMGEKAACKYVNQSFVKILGYTADEINSSDQFVMVHPEVRQMVAENAQKRLSGQDVPGRYEMKLLTKNKETVIADFSATIIEYENTKAILTAAMDITDRKKAEEKIKIANEQLQQTNAEKDKLFTIIAHDLKSPLSGVFSTSEILAKEAKSLTLEEISQISAEVHKSSKNALGLLNDLMQWARMSQGGMDFSPEECGLHELASSSLYTARDVANKKDITIQSDIPADLNVMVDQAMINTVIRNVIFNAIKFSHQGGNITITAQKASPFVEVCVQDEGIGMCEKVMSSVFSLDKNKRQYGTGGEKGTGLGLILCKEFVEKHGGQIWLESEPGKGTKVFFTLPCDQDIR